MRHRVNASCQKMIKNYIEILQTVHQHFLEFVASIIDTLHLFSISYQHVLWFWFKTQMKLNKIKNLADVRLTSQGRLHRVGNDLNSDLLRTNPK